MQVIQGLFSLSNEPPIPEAGSARHFSQFYQLMRTVQPNPSVCSRFRGKGNPCRSLRAFFNPLISRTMQEDLDKTTGMESMSIEEMFLKSQESYQEAQQRALEENKAFARTEFFRMDKFGVYRLRILPLAPNADGSPSRPGYEFPVHQLLLELEKPTTGN